MIFLKFVVQTKCTMIMIAYLMPAWYTYTILASCSLWNATLDIPSNAIVSFMFRLFIKYTVSDI